eukprot:11163394-Lingulodinium_polyedra.AAC.1
MGTMPGKPSKAAPTSKKSGCGSSRSFFKRPSSGRSFTNARPRGPAEAYRSGLPRATGRSRGRGGRRSASRQRSLSKADMGGVCPPRTQSRGSGSTRPNRPSAKARMLSRPGACQTEPPG